MDNIKIIDNIPGNDGKNGVWEEWIDADVWDEAAAAAATAAAAANGIPRRNALICNSLIFDTVGLISDGYCRKKTKIFN